VSAVNGPVNMENSDENTLDINTFKKITASILIPRGSLKSNGLPTENNLLQFRVPEAAERKKKTEVWTCLCS
jgi:hypothetical protein